MLALAYGGYSPVKAEGKNYSDYVNPLMAKQNYKYEYHVSQC